MTRFSALFKREVMRFVRVIGQTVLTPMITATLYLVIFGLSVGQHLQISEDISYLMFLVPGLVMMGVLNNAFQNGAGSVLTSKFHGDLEDLRTTPLSAHVVVWAKSLAGLLRGGIVGCMVLVTAEFFSYIHTGELFGVKHVGWCLIFLSLGGLSFAHLGLTLGFFAKTFDQVNAVGQFVVLPLIYLGGVFFSLENLHAFWRNLSLVNPLLYFVNGVRYAMLGISDVPPVTCLIVSLASLTLFTGLAYSSVRWGSYQRF